MSEEKHEIDQRINTWERVISLAQVSQDLNEMLERYINNPYRIEPLNNAIDININLSPEIVLSIYVSNAIFRTEIAITGLKIHKATVELKYRAIYGEDTTRSFSYIINLNSEKIMVKDLFLLLYVFVNMSQDDIKEIKHIVNSYFNRIETEKDMVRTYIQYKGIEIEK